MGLGFVSGVSLTPGKVVKFSLDSLSAFYVVDAVSLSLSLSGWGAGPRSHVLRRGKTNPGMLLGGGGFLSSDLGTAGHCGPCGWYLGQESHG